MKMLSKIAFIFMFSVLFLEVAPFVEAQVARPPRVYRGSTTGISVEEYGDVNVHRFGSEVKGLEPINLLERKPENLGEVISTEVVNSDLQEKKNFWQRLIIRLNQPLKNPTLISIESRLRNWDERFGMKAIFGKESDAIANAIRARSVSGVFKNLGRALVKDAAIAAGALAIGVLAGVGYSIATTGKFVLPAGLRALGLRTAGRLGKITGSVKSGWTWLKGSAVAAWKFIDNSTKSLTRVVNRVSNSANKVLTVIKNVRLELSGLAKAINSWRKIASGVLSFLFMIGNGLSLNPNMPTSMPNSPTTKTEQAAGGNKTDSGFKPSSGNRVSTKAEGSTSNTTASKDSNKETKSNSGEVSAKTIDVSMKDGSTGTGHGKTAGATSEKTSNTARVNTNQVSGGATLAVASGGKTASVKSDSASIKTSSGEASEKTTQSKLSVPASLTSGLKTLNSNLSKASKEIAKIATWDVPRFFSAGMLPRGENSAPATTYQKVTLAVWTAFFSILIAVIAVWFWGRFKKENDDEKLEEVA